MCFEDVKLGRAKSTAVTYITDPGGSTYKIPANADRVGLIVANPAAGSIKLFPTGGDGISTSCFNIFAASPPIIIDIETWGDVVTKDWLIADDGLAHNIMYIEVFLSKRE